MGYIPVQTWRRRLPLSAAAVACALYAWLVLLPIVAPHPPRADDFQDYWQAALQIRIGGDPYAAFERTHVPWDWTLSSGYDYPPAFAGLLAPLTVLPNDLAVRGWLVLMLALMAGSLAVVYRVLGPPGRAELVCMILVFVTFFPVTATLQTGAMNPVLLLLLTLGWAAWLRGRDLAAGSAWGAAIAIKLIPIGLVPYLLVRRQLRLLLALAAAVAIGVGFGLLVTNPSHSLHYFRDILPHLVAGSGYRENQSITGLATRLCDPRTASLGGSAGWCGRLVAWPAIAAVLALVALAVRMPGRHGLEVGLAVAVLPLVSSVTWSFHLVLLLLPIALLLHHHFRVSALPAWRVRALLLAWLCCSALPALHYALIIHPLPVGAWAAVASRLVGESYLAGILLLLAVIWLTVREAASVRTAGLANAA